MFYKDCVIVYLNGKCVRMRATKLTIVEKTALVYDSESVMAVVNLDSIKTILFCDMADIQAIVEAISSVDNEEERAERRQRRKEKDTQCDTCPHLQECIEKGNVLDSTGYYDSRKHYIKGLCEDCPVMGEYFYSHEIAMEAKDGR